VQRVGIIGTGVIGGGWAAHFLRNGMDVVAYDPAPGAEEKLRRRIDDVWSTLARLGLHANASPDRLTFADSLAAAVADAEFVQENAPERAQIKIDTLAAIDAAAPVDTVIASSTSGYAMTMMAQKCVHPERCVVAFYRATGKQPLKLTKEIPGFVADRLMEAIWREALHMINNDMATVEEIDAAIRYGPGLRWALMGPLTVLHLGGGEGGMAHLIHQFGPSLKEPWTFLEAPELTDELAQKVIDGCANLTQGFSIRDLEQERDDLLIKLLEMLNQSKLWHLGQEHNNGFR
jgi:carnitine 3-dehydrogenase